MKHVELALQKLAERGNPLATYITVSDLGTEGVAPVVCFSVQDGPIKEVGVNGIQARDMLEYMECLFESLNDAFPSTYNAETAYHIREAINSQDARTRDREARGVEGQNKA